MPYSFPRAQGSRGWGGALQVTWEKWKQFTRVYLGETLLPLMLLVVGCELDAGLSSVWGFLPLNPLSTSSLFVLPSLLEYCLLA